MGLFRFIDTEIWQDPWFRRLNPEEKTVFLWCITTDRIKPSGVVETDWEHIRFETQVDDVGSVIERLDPKVQVVYENGGRWLFVTNFLRRQRSRMNAKNQDISAAKSLRSVPFPVHAAVLAEYPELREHLESHQNPKEPTEHQAMAIALAKIEGRDEPLPSDWSRLGKVGKELLLAGATPEDVLERADRYIECRPEWDLTAQALLKWWSAIPGWTPTQGKATVKHGLASALLDQARQMGGDDGAEGSDTGRGRPLRGLPGQ